MSMPGFGAETSLYGTRTDLHKTFTHPHRLGARAVIPQLPIFSGCGDCTALTWPDGTRTGACARACCDPLRCWTETCACGGSTGIFRGGFGSARFAGSVTAF
jgi:hypothetical protein